MDVFSALVAFYLFLLLKEFFKKELNLPFTVAMKLPPKMFLFFMIIANIYFAEKLTSIYFS